MQDVVSIGSDAPRPGGVPRAVSRFLGYLPRGNTLDDRAWSRRHRMLEWVLLLHVPGLVLLGMSLGTPMTSIAEAVALPVVCLVVGHVLTHRRLASFFITGGLVFCSVALVLLTRGSIEAHFHFFIIIGFIALYQDWVPFLWNVAFTTLSHGIGTIWLGGQIFNHPAAQANPWLWSFIHGLGVLLACVGMVIFWRVTEDEQTEKEALGRQLLTADAEIGRRQFTSEMLVNLARRNQSMLYRQLDIINQLEDKEQDADALAELFKLDHLATRVRRNAESLLVLAGEQSPRTWSAPVALRDVVRAAIAETEDLERVVFAIDDRVSVSGASVADLTHLLAELTENAVRFSPPETVVTIRARPNRRDEGGQLLTVEDWGVGMPPDDLAEANELLATPHDVDLAVSQRLGFHVVARLAARHRITVSLGATPGSGITAVVVLPAALFTAGGSAGPAGDGARPHVGGASPLVEDREPGWIEAIPAVGGVAARRAPAPDAAPWPDPAWASAPFATAGVTGGPGAGDGNWQGWWDPETHGAAALQGGAGHGPAENGHGPNGHGPNGHAVNGHGPNGHGVDGHGANGHAVNGHGPNGHGVDGHGPNGHGVGGHGVDRHGSNGLAANGHGANGQGMYGQGMYGQGMYGQGTNGLGIDGYAANGQGTNGLGIDGYGPNGHGIDGYGPNGHGIDGYGPNGHGSPAVFGDLAGPGLDDHAPDGPGYVSFAGDVAGDTAADVLPDLGPGRIPAPGGPAGPGGTDGTADGPDRAPRIPDARQEWGPGPTVIEQSRGPADGSVLGPRVSPPRPAPSTGPVPSPMPKPRPDGPVVPGHGPQRSTAVTGGRGLRRRVPQSHLAPELRHPGAAGLEETVTPPSADTAATALSRYQASRRAAQAVVDVPTDTPVDEGDRA